jgi:hypothetical protein
MRGLALTLGSVVGACGLLAFAALASAHHANAKHKKHHAAASELRCDAYFSTNAISTLTGTAPGVMGAQEPPYGTGQIAGSWKAGTDNSMWAISSAGTPAGSQCAWVNESGPGLGDDDSLQAWAAVGYGVSQKNWKAMWAHGGPGFTSGEGTLESTTPVNVGHGAQAYVQTFDLWEDGVDTYFDPPQYLYAVTLLTKHHNVLLLAPETAPLASVEASVEAVLTAYAKF